MLLAEPLETHAEISTSNLPTHNSITLYPRTNTPGMAVFPFLWRDKNLISFGVEKHITSLQIVCSHICGLLISENVNCDISNLIYCIHTILVFNNMLNVFHTENPVVSSSRNSDGKN